MYKVEVKTNSALLHAIYSIADDAIANDQVEFTKIGLSQKEDKVVVIEVTDFDKYTKKDGETYNEIECESITAFDSDTFTTFVDTDKVKDILKTIGIKL